MRDPSTTAQERGYTLAEVATRQHEPGVRLLLCLAPHENTTGTFGRLQRLGWAICNCSGPDGSEVTIERKP